MEDLQRAEGESAALAQQLQRRAEELQAVREEAAEAEEVRRREVEANEALRLEDSVAQWVASFFLLGKGNPLQGSLKGLHFATI